MQNPMYTGALTDKNIRAIFPEAGDFIARQLQCGPFTLYAYSIDGLTSGGDASEYVFKPITEHLIAKTMQELYAFALHGGVYNSVADPCEDLDTVALKLVNGFCVVLFPEVGAVAYEVKTGEKRGLSAPQTENTIKGPKDAFVETVRSNTSLIRRHIRSPKLRLWETRVGKQSLTNVSVVWMEGITRPDLVNRMKKRLESMEVDALLSPAAVEEYVTGPRKTAFPLLQYTERTDTFCRGVLDGRVGLLVDGLPVGYLAPVDIGYMMTSAEDYGRDFISASAVRVLRYVALLISLFLPGLFIALTVHHPQLMPQALHGIVAQSRANIPVSTIWEVLGILVAFELLQESGIHLPQSIGQSVSIIGGIVVGTAGAEAGLISSVALIMVSVAGVCGFVLPNRDFATAIRVWRFLLALLCAAGGFVGLAIGLAVLLWHLGHLRSLGVSYLVPFEPGLLRKRMMAKRRKYHCANCTEPDQEL